MYTYVRAFSVSTSAAWMGQIAGPLRKIRHIFLQLEMMGNPVDLFNQSGLLQLLLIGGDWNIFNCSIQLGIYNHPN